MKRFVPMLLLVAVLTTGFAATAGATVWWEAQYDIAGSTSVVNIYDPALPPPGNPPLLTFAPNPVTGTMTVRWGAATVAAPITQGVLLGGDTTADQYLDASIFIVTGSANSLFILPPYGAFGAIAGGDFTPPIVADSSTTGSITCTAGNCALGGFTLSVPQPLTPVGSGPFPLTLPKWSFTGGNAGLDLDWTAPVISQTIPAGTGTSPDPAFTNIIQTTYVGHEISRVFVPEPSFSSLFVPGLGMLGALGWLRGRRS